MLNPPSGLYIVQDIGEITQIIRELNLMFLAMGSSRKVYVLDKEYVLKVATNDAGIAQNRTEALFSKRHSDAPITKVVEHHKRYLWLIAERAEPLKYGDPVSVWPELNGISDLEEITNLGRLRGEIVAVDYGLNSFVRKRFYAWS